MNPKVLCAVRFVDGNLHRDVYLAEIAHLVNLSSSRFCHLFKSEMGMPFGKFLKKARMERACHLLESTLESVKAIASQVGYNHSDHFEREFKKTYRTTPSQHRAA